MTTTAAPLTRPPGPAAVASALWILFKPARFSSIPPTETVTYRNPPHARGIAPRADIYLPPNSGAHTPSVIIVHGGGFILGSRNMKPVRFLARRLVEAGYAVFAMDYRMVFRGGRLSEAEDDVVAAMSYWQDQVAARGLDGDRISAMGFSAGGTLMLLAARKVRPLHRLIGIFGLYNFEHLTGPFAGLLPRLVLRTSRKDEWRAASPLFQSPAPSPLLLLHGTRDALVPVAQADDLAGARARSGLTTRTVKFPGEPHAFFNLEGEAAERGTAEIVGFLSTPVLDRVAPAPEPAVV